MHRRFAHAAAIFAGATMPTIIFSRAVFAVFVTLAVGSSVLAIVSGPTLRSLRSVVWPALLAAIVAMFAVWMISSLQGIYVERSLMLWLQTLAMVVCGWTVYAALRSDADAPEVALRSLIVSALVCGTIAILSMTVWHGFIDPAEVRGIEHLSHSRQKLKKLGSVVPCLLPVVVWASFRLGGAWRIAALAFPPMALAIVVLVNSGSGKLGLIAMLVVLIAARSIVALRPKAATAAAAVVLAVALGGAGTIIAKLPELPVRTLAEYRIPKIMVDYHRQAIWSFVIGKANESPVLGYGVGNSRHIPGAKRIESKNAAEYVPAHPHNWIIQLYAETGLVGLLAALIVLGLVATRLLRAAARRSGAALAGLAMLGAGFGSWLTNFKVWAAWWNIELFFLLAIVWAFLPPATGSTRQSTPDGKPPAPTT